MIQFKENTLGGGGGGGGAGAGVFSDGKIYLKVNL